MRLEQADQAGNPLTLQTAVRITHIPSGVVVSQQDENLNTKIKQKL